MKEELKRINDDCVHKNQRLEKERTLYMAKLEAAKGSVHRSINEVKAVTNQFDIKGLLNASTPLKSLTFLK